tara:strand:+ start:449 stop:622 length:174 start_codon:yes stop_codon:yes gene_type:complete
MKKIVIEINTDEIIKILENSDEVVLKLTADGTTDEPDVEKMLADLPEEIQDKIRWPF